MEGARVPGSSLPDLTPDRLSGETVARLTQAAGLLRKAERPVRVLRAVAWGPEVSARFFANGEKEMPQVAYPRMSAAPVHEILAAARVLIDGDGPVQAWLRRIADVIAISADMLQALGTKEFHRLSVQLYGSPEIDLLNCDVTPLDLAHMLDQVLSPFANVELNLGATDVKTNAADLTNMGRMPSHASMGGGSNVAAHFLREFAEGPYTHIDIFNSTWNWSGDYPGAHYGATGAPFNSLWTALGGI